MKKVFAILIALMILASSAICFANGNAAEEEIPENVMHYAEYTALPYYKREMKLGGYIPQFVSSENEIDSLSLGEGYRLYAFQTENVETISETLRPLEQWLFTLDLDEPFMYFYVRGGDPITTVGPFSAKNLIPAFEVFERVAKNAGIEFKPILLHLSYYELALYMDFNGDERVLPVPSDAFDLDKDYLSVEYYTQLPTGKEYIDAHNEIIAWAAAHPDQAGGPNEAMLSPKLDAAAPYGRPVSPAMRILPYAACVIGAAAFIVIAIALKKEKARAND